MMNAVRLKQVCVGYLQLSLQELIRRSLIVEQHVTEDMGFLPTPEWWLSNMTLTPAMNKVPTKPEEHRTISELAEIRDKAQQDIARALYRGEG